MDLENKAKFSQWAAFLRFFIFFPSVAFLYDFKPYICFYFFFRLFLPPKNEHFFILCLFNTVEKRAPLIKIEKTGKTVEFRVFSGFSWNFPKFFLKSKATVFSGFCQKSRKFPVFPGFSGIPRIVQVFQKMSRFPIFHQIPGIPGFWRSGISQNSRKRHFSKTQAQFGSFSFYLCFHVLFAIKIL